MGMLMLSKRNVAGAGMAGLLLVGAAAAPFATVVGTAAAAGGAADTKAAARAASTASGALAKHDWARAVRFAEKAVAASPHDAGHRALLGEAYLRAGRFASAAQALSDALLLDPTNGRVALNLSLAQVGAGQWNVAKATLLTHAETIAPVDRGLALALAGDPAAAVEVLTPAARSPGADAKTRQNLALALALAGRWPESRALVAVDLPADQVTERMQQWALFASPKSASDQVASLLGVTPVLDPGQPVALALNGAAPTTATALVDPYLSEPAPVAVASEATRVVFGPRQEVVQPLPAKAVSVRSPVLIAAAPGSYKTSIAETPDTALPKSRAAATGAWFVQIGAYANAAVARDDWSRATRRLPALADYTPMGATAQVRGRDVYRLSVGNLARRDADGLCRDYRKSGGVCFVRPARGEAMAAWHKPQAPVGTAARKDKGVETAAR